MFGYGAAFAVVLSAFNYTGGRLSGYSRHEDVDEVSRKEYLRKNRRRPLAETVQELGEGRGRYTHAILWQNSKQISRTESWLGRTLAHMPQGFTRQATESDEPSVSRRRTASTCNILLRFLPHRLAEMEHCARSLPILLTEDIPCVHSQPMRKMKNVGCLTAVASVAEPPWPVLGMYISVSIAGPSSSLSQQSQWPRSSDRTCLEDSGHVDPRNVPRHSGLYFRSHNGLG